MELVDESVKSLDGHATITEDVKLAVLLTAARLTQSRELLPVMMLNGPVIAEFLYVEMLFCWREQMCMTECD